MSDNSKKIDNKKLFDAFIGLLKTAALSGISKLGGFYGFIANIALNYTIKILKKVGVRIGENQDAAERLKKYEDRRNNPKTSPDDRRNAERDFLSGK